MLMEFPSSSQLDIELIYSKWINYNVDIDYIVIIRGFGDEEFKAEFTLTRDNIGSFWRLSSGKTPEICDQLSSEQVVNSFVKLMKGVILGRNEQLIGDLFLDSFVFYGCKTNYQKAEAIQLLLSLPATMRFTISSSQLISDSQITFTVKIGEIGSNEIISEVHLYRDSMIMSHWKLSSGAVKNCGQVSEKRSVEDSDYGFGPYF
uniref:DUF2163 domain-containing protein n=2 Tax=Caenorhabditis tropicalis TaxID=1561998 RepID=A0A1I7UE86_9PELO